MLSNFFFFKQYAESHAVLLVKIVYLYLCGECHDWLIFSKSSIYTKQMIF